MELFKDTDDDIYYCVTTYEEKDIPKNAGFKWNGNRWQTASPVIASAIQEYASEDLKKEIASEARKRRRAKKKEEKKKEKVRAASKAQSTDFFIEAGSGLSFLPYQLAGIEQASKRKNILIADEMGLGKTAQVIGTINALKTVKSVLIIATASLAKNWKREIEKFGTRTDLSVGFATTKKLDANANILITTYDVFSRKNDIAKILKEKKYDLLVLDECHYVKNEKSARTMEILGFSRKGITGIQADRKIFLTGTPILNRPVEIWPVAHALDPENFGNFMRFANRFCDAKQTNFGWDFTGNSNLDELNDLLSTTIMVRRKKADVLEELPSKIRQIIELPVVSAAERKAISAEKDIRAKYEKIQAENDEINAQIEKLKKDKKSTSSQDYREQIRLLKLRLQHVPFEELSQARHDTALAKLPQAISFIKDILEEDTSKKLIVFAHHKDVIEELSKGLKDFGTLEITGETPPSKRLDIVDRFQNDDSERVFIGSIHACAEGLTLTRASHVVFVELDWTPAKMSQAEDRAHRIGQKDTVLVQHILLEDSYDANMAYKIAEKQLVIDKAIQ